MNLSRRRFLSLSAGLVAAPAVIRVARLMLVSVVEGDKIFPPPPLSELWMLTRKVFLLKICVRHPLLALDKAQQAEIGKASFPSYRSGVPIRWRS